MEKKALVCITPQSNSRRLIDKGSDLIKANGGGELFILHILKGADIFADDQTGNLLQELFEYGKLKGGSIHALSGENIGRTIEKFAKDHGITDIILGEAPAGTGTGKRPHKAVAMSMGMPMVNTDVSSIIRTQLPWVNVVVLERGMD